MSSRYREFARNAINSVSRIEFFRIKEGFTRQKCLRSERDKDRALEIAWTRTRMSSKGWKIEKAYIVVPLSPPKLFHLLLATGDTC